MIRKRRTNLLGAILIWVALLVAPSVMVSHAVAANSVHVDVVPLDGSVSTDATDSDGSTGEPDTGQTRQPTQIGQTPPRTTQSSGMGWIEATMWVWRAVFINAR